MANKYLKGGALNPAWCDEQDAALITKNIMDGMESLFNIFRNMDMEFNLQLGEGVDINISKYKEKETKEMCTIINTENDYEAKFNFIKKHSATPEDLELAKEIVGLK